MAHSPLLLNLGDLDSRLQEARVSVSKASDEGVNLDYLSERRQLRLLCLFKDCL